MYKRQSKQKTIEKHEKEQLQTTVISVCQLFIFISSIAAVTLAGDDTINDVPNHFAVVIDGIS